MYYRFYNLNFFSSVGGSVPPESPSPPVNISLDILYRCSVWIPVLSLWHYSILANYPASLVNSFTVQLTVIILITITIFYRKYVVYNLYKFTQFN